MKRVLFFIGHLLRLMGLGKLAFLARSVRDNIYTGYHADRFNSFSRGKIEYPAEQITGHRFISVGQGTLLGKHIVLTAFEKRGDQTFQPRICIGDHCILGEHMHITAVGNVKIGNSLLAGRFCLITDNSHGMINYEELSTHPIDRPLSHKDVSIGDNVWLGDAVRILPGVTIGNGCIIGAGSIVTKDVPDFCVAAGNPARIIKRLNES